MQIIYGCQARVSFRNPPSDEKRDWASQKVSAETSNQVGKHVADVAKAALDVFVSATKALKAEKE
jgi:hypothetical protein